MKTVKKADVLDEKKLGAALKKLNVQPIPVRRLLPSAGRVAPSSGARRRVSSCFSFRAACISWSCPPSHSPPPPVKTSHHRCLFPLLLQGIEEVMIMKEDGNTIHFSSPKGA